MITPVLYREHLMESLRSILANNCDAIIVNDSDQPLDLDLPGVTVLNNDANRGVGFSRARGVREALSKKYEFIGFVDADSVLTPNWCQEALQVLKGESSLLGVSGLALNANQKPRIARVKFLFKAYGRRRGVPFQIDCSLFRREAFELADFGGKRIGEDSHFIQALDPRRIGVVETAVSHHYEVESTHEFFLKELLGALYSTSSGRRVALSFLLTPVTCIRMASLRDRHADYTLAALFWAGRQLIWTLAYALGSPTGHRQAIKPRLRGT